jgi:hypothetical protein
VKCVHVRMFLLPTVAAPIFAQRKTNYSLSMINLCCYEIRLTTVRNVYHKLKCRDLLFRNKKLPTVGWPRVTFLCKEQH